MSHDYRFRVYGIYQADNYPEWDILAVDFHKFKWKGKKKESLYGIAFLKNSGEFDTIVDLRIDRLKNPVEVGYIYNRPETDTIFLRKEIKNEG